MAESLDVSRTPIPVFDGQRFSLYKMQMMAHLAFKELLDVVEAPVVGLQSSSLGANVTVGGEASETEVKEENLTNAQKAKIKKSLQAYNILLLSLKPEQLQMVVDIPRGNAHGVWSALLSRYERKTVASKISLRNELHNLKMKSAEHIDSYISRLKQLVLSLAEMGSRMSNDELIYILFKGLPETYQATIDTLSLKDKLEFEEGCTYVRDRYERIQVKENEEQTNGDMISYLKDKYRDQHIPKKQDKTQKICNTCGKHGHIPFYCHDNKDRMKCNYCKKSWS